MKEATFEKIPGFPTEPHPIPQENIPVKTGRSFSSEQMRGLPESPGQASADFCSIRFYKENLSISYNTIQILNPKIKNQRGVDKLI